METVQHNGRFTLFSSKFPSNIYSIFSMTILSGQKQFFPQTLNLYLTQYMWDIKKIIPFFFYICSFEQKSDLMYNKSPFLKTRNCT